MFCSDPIPAEDEIRRQLQLILTSSPFRRSERLQSFLSFIVEETLAGRGAQIKEYSIALSVFRRGESYDPKSDALVRVEARRLRERLREYYAGEGAAAAVVIDLPRGSYRAAFSRRKGAGRRSRWSLAVAALVVGAVGMALVARAPAPPPMASFGSDARAHELYWQGVYLRQQRSEANVRASVGLFEQVVARQPDNAHGLAALAHGYAWMAFFEISSWRENSERARRMAQRALRRDPRRAEAWEALGLVALYKEWNWSEAESALLRAVAAEPGYAPAHHSLGLGLAAHGRFSEALAEAGRASELDPSSYVANDDLAVVLYCAGRYEEARRLALTTQSLRPEWAAAYTMAGLSDAARNNLAEAAGEFRRAMALAPRDPYPAARLANVLGRAGERAKAAELARRLEREARDGTVPHVNLCWAYLGLGEYPRALDELERAAAERETDVLFLAVDPVYHPLAGEPRMDLLLRRIGLR
jgi:tetratricopeptide (TPR) repeat protein